MVKMYEGGRLLSPSSRVDLMILYFGCVFFIGVFELENPPPGVLEGGLVWVG
jgi:hypothetical protein